MHIRFNLDLNDLKACQSRVCRRLNRAARAGIAGQVCATLAWIPIGIAAVRYLDLFRKYPEAGADLTRVAVLLGVGVGALVAAWFAANALRMRSIAASDGLYFSPQAVELSAEGLFVRTSTVEARYRWGAFPHYEEDAARLYLYVDTFAALVLPKSAFQSPEQIDRVRGWLSVGCGVKP